MKKSNETFPCRDCGVTVAWATSRKTGKRYLAQPKEWYGEEHGAQRIYLPAHRCMATPETIAQREAEREAKRAARQAMFDASLKQPDRDPLFAFGSMPKVQVAS